MDVEIKKLEAHNINAFMELIRIFETVFEWEKDVIPDTAHLQSISHKPVLSVFAAIADAKIAGGLTAYVLRGDDSEKPSVYLYNTGVLSSLQKKGTGAINNGM